MNNPTQQQAPNIDFGATTSIDGFDGGKLFGQAFVLRKVSKFVVGGMKMLSYLYQYFMIWKQRKL